MKKISLNSVESHEPENGLAIDESLIPHPTDNASKTAVAGQKEAPMAKKKGNTIGLVILFVAIVAGIGTGFGVNAYMGGGSSGAAEITQVGSPTNGIKVDEVYGTPNEEGLKDSAEGVIQIGGLEGEGSHRLVRPGGETQTVYLTSSTVDLDKFENAKVKIWGETFAAQKAGWLMDVQRVKVVEVDAELPSEE